MDTLQELEVSTVLNEARSVSRPSSPHDISTPRLFK